ncbi:aldo/keto reductase [Paraburkholderia sediminicola]|uniref:aldo/keto reductase n=1 Tax=Paraburkholderia sediminicola TaxID=458836 RepID=UPI0038B980B4
MGTQNPPPADQTRPGIRFRRFHDLDVSEIGLGCASAWGQPWFSEQKAIGVVERALELGITVFDTGPTYSGGNAEPRLGKALQGKDISRLLVSTKIGTHMDSNGRLYKDWTKKAIFASIDASRTRLGLDRIPLMYLHGPRPGDLGGELIDALEEARSRGIVRWFGVNSFDTDMLEMLPAVATIDVVMLDYNLLRIHREPTIDSLSSAGKMVVAGSALANHVHAPKFLWPKSKTDIWYALRALKNYRGDYLRARRLSFLKGLSDWTPAQVALSFIAANPSVFTSMFSTTRVEHLEENARACGTPLPPAIYQQIRQALK